MQRSGLALAALAVIAAGGLWLLLRGDSGTVVPARADGSARADGAGAPTAPLAPGAELAGDAAPGQERTAASDVAGAVLAPEVESEFGSLRVTLRSTPWVDIATAEATFEWTPRDGRSRSERATLGRVIELDGVPREANEFEEVWVADLEARVVALKDVTTEGAPDGPRVAELELALVPGATVGWDVSVPTERRVPVTLSLGGSVSPPSRAVWRHGRRPGLVTSTDPVELPVRLPRVARDEILWVGGAGLAWHEFAVRPDSTRVDVWVEPGVSIRVEHDLDPSDGDLHAWAMEFPSGDAEKAAVDGRGVVALGPRRAGTLEVWISDGGDHDSPRVTRTARFDATAGEEVVVDLTQAYAREHLGSLRVELRSAYEAAGVPRADISLRIVGRTPAGSESAWARAGEVQALADESAEGWVYGVDGLEPGDYRVLVAPFALRIPVRIEAGQRLERVVSLDGVGWIEVAFAEGEERDPLFLRLSSTDPEREQRNTFSMGDGRLREGRTMWPVVPGRYTASHWSFGRRSTAYTSDPFDVVAGRVVRVELMERELWVVDVRAKDVDSGEPIALDTDFWVDLRLVDTATEQPLSTATSLRAGGEPAVGCRLQFDAVEGALRVELPDHPHWDFETLEPRVLEDGATIELMGHRRRR